MRVAGRMCATEMEMRAAESRRGGGPADSSEIYPEGRWGVGGGGPRGCGGVLIAMRAGWAGRRVMAVLRECECADGDGGGVGGGLAKGGLAEGVGMRLSLGLSALNRSGSASPP